MERIGVNNSFLGTYDQYWNLSMILSLAMMKNIKFWLYFLFFGYFISATNKFCRNAITSTDVFLGIDLFISTAACDFIRWLVLPTTWPHECHTIEINIYIPHVWISIANCGCTKIFILIEGPGTLEYKFLFAPNNYQWYLYEYSGNYPILWFTKICFARHSCATFG